MPDTVGHSRSDMELQVGMLPQVAAFGSVNGRNRVTGAFTIHILGPLYRLRQCFVAEFQQALGRFRIVEHIERQTIRLRIPESQPAVGFTGQTFRTDIIAGMVAVVRLVQLKNTKADALLILRVTFNNDIAGLPNPLPVSGLSIEYFSLI
ncbi:hypothetical protein D3C75_757150 [compost metagenome]